MCCPWSWLRPLLLLGVAASPYFIGLYQSLTGVLAGFILMGVIYLVANYIWLRLRKMEAMGDGDVFLMAAAGAWVGSAQIFYVLFLANVLCLLYHFLFAALPYLYQAIVARRRPQKNIYFGVSIYFGPFIAAAAALMFFYGESLIIFFYQALQATLPF